MLSDDLSDAKVIDFSYSTPLKKKDLNECPKILWGFLDGTPQFQPPECMEKKRIPVMDDFSKIDVWALAITLINMLTLEFPFFQVNDDFENYDKFIKNPQIFF